MDALLRLLLRRRWRRSDLDRVILQAEKKKNKLFIVLVRARPSRSVTMYELLLETPGLLLTNFHVPSLSATRGLLGLMG